LLALACGCNLETGAGAPPPSLLGAAPPPGPARSITADDLVALRDIDAVVVSPDGSRVAYLLRRADAERDAYDTGWFVVGAADAGEPVYLGDGGEPQLATTPNGHQVGEVAAPPAAWSPDGRWLAYLVQAGGEIQLWRSRADGARREQLTRLASDVVDFAWSTDGANLLVLAGRETRAEAAEARAEEGRRGFLLDDRFNPGHAPTPLYREPDTPRAWLLDVRTRTIRLAMAGEAAELGGGLATRAAGASEAREAPASPDGRVVARLEQERDAAGGRPDRLVAASRNGGLLRRRAPVCAGALALLGWTEDGREVAFVRRFGVSGRMTSLQVWAPAEDSVRTLIETEALLDGCALAGARVVCAQETATTPRRLIAIDLDDGGVRTLVDPNPELSGVAFGRVETADLTNRFGHESFAQILTPPDYVEGRAYPVVVTTYRSRGFLRGGVGDEYPPHLFAAAGLVVLSFDMPDADVHPVEDRGARAWPDCPACGAGELRHASAAASLELGLEALEDRGLLDPERVAITGLSSGASIAFDALTRETRPGSDRRFSAAIVSYAAGDPIAAYVAPRAWRESWISDIGGLPEEGGRRYLERVSPALNASRIEAPILMNVADRELVQSLQTIATLEHLGKPLEVLVYPGERHVKRSPAHRLAIYRRNLQWLQFWLQDKEPDEPLDPGQIERWRALRERAAEAAHEAD
jgi:dipeptidyl aminopeptidase/acylaminoacyl peptidase